MSEFNTKRNSFNIYSVESITLYILLTIYIILSLQNILSSGYYGDDMAASTTKGQIELNNMSYFTHIISYIIFHAKYSGRFIPINNVAITSMNYFFYNLFLYKLATLIFLVINIYLFGYFITVIGRDKYLSYVLMAIIPAFFQFRIYHDPILSYYGLQQIFFAYLMISLIFLYKFIEYNKKKYLLISIGFYNLLLYTYELGFIFIIVYICIILWSKLNIKQKFHSLSPFLFLFIIATLVNIFMRTKFKNTDSGYDGITFNLNTVLIFRTFMLQAYSSTPLSYYISNPSKLFSTLYHGEYFRFNCGIISAMSIFSIIYFYCVPKVKIETTGKKILLFGLATLILPAIMISLSLKYQQEFSWFGGMGIGYLPVYIQYYGVLMIFSALILFLSKWLRSTSLHLYSTILLLLIINLVIYTNIRNNTIVIERLNYDMHYRRTTLERALKNGMLDKVPENSTLIIVDKYNYDPFPSSVTSLKGWANLYEWNNSYFIYLNTKKRYRVIRNNSELGLFYSSLINKNLSNTENLYEINIHAYPDDKHNKEGYIVLKKIIDYTDRLNYGSWEVY